MSNNDFVFEIPISEIANKSLFRSCYAKDLIENFKNILIYRYKNNNVGGDA